MSKSSKGGLIFSIRAWERDGRAWNITSFFVQKFSWRQKPKTKIAAKLGPPKEVAVVDDVSTDKLIKRKIKVMLTQRTNGWWQSSQQYAS